MRTDELDFNLPPELIAQSPTVERSASRLLHYRRADESISHRRFTDLPSLLRAGDLLVFNDAKVTPARFFVRKPTGGRVEGLFLKEESAGQWRALLRNLGREQERYTVEGDPSLTMTIAARHGEGEFSILISGVSAESAEAVLGRVGHMPLPPYIRRSGEADEAFDRERYQTVYARQSGSVAAPTAGLHFTPEVLAELAGRGIESAHVTLDVGVGTFKPVAADTLADHRMHTERYRLPEATASAINTARRDNRRVIAVGTTSARVLESQPDGDLGPASGETDIFIYPPYRWKHVDALVTNFHLPRSTLIALVAALVGTDAQRRIYQEAISQRYRFFSYGDSSFLE